jgi:cellulose synthase/poly-beta-1,6-N-acetylglucosamine synthase-like glycosyltransferase
MKHLIAKYTSVYTRRFKVNDTYFPEPPHDKLSLIVVIPAYKEHAIFSTLKSLSQCIAPKGRVELIVVVNASENAEEEELMANQKTINQIKNWDDTMSSESISIMVIREEKLPGKFAGAGLARKIGMDEALRRWALSGVDGVILCLDADCIVSEDYLIAAEEAFADPEVQLGHYQFEHLFDKEKDSLLKNGIMQYELHLRYHIQGLKWAGYPFAKHTYPSDKPHLPEFLNSG